MGKFKVGDIVTWKSQAGGHWKTKEGTVIEVVRPFGSPKVPGLFFTAWRRPKESYVISVPQGGRRVPKLYAPDANRLTPKCPITQ